MSFHRPHKVLPTEPAVAPSDAISYEALTRDGELLESVLEAAQRPDLPVIEL